MEREGGVKGYATTSCWGEVQSGRLLVYFLVSPPLAPPTSLAQPLMTSEILNPAQTGPPVLRSHCGFCSETKGLDHGDGFYAGMPIPCGDGYAGFCVHGKCEIKYNMATCRCATT